MLLTGCKLISTPSRGFGHLFSQTKKTSKVAVMFYFSNLYFAQSLSPGIQWSNFTEQSKKERKSPENHIFSPLFPASCKKPFVPALQDTEWSFMLGRGQETGQFQQTHHLGSRAIKSDDFF